MASYACPYDSLDTTLEIVYWIDLAIFGLATIVSLFFWIYTYVCSDKESVCQYVSKKSCNPCNTLPDASSDRSNQFHRHLNKTYANDIGSYFHFRSLSIAFVIFFLNTLLYGVLLMIQGTIYNEELDLCIPWLRWVIYSISCSLLAYEIATYQMFEQDIKYIFTFLITVTLLTGTFSTLSVESYTNRWIWFAIGFAPYIIALLLLFVFSDPCRKFHCPKFKYVVPVFVLLFWSIYPVAFLLGPNILDVISITTESIIYLVGDVFTKIIFAFAIAVMSQQ